MALYTIADLHLSIGLNKPMDIFKGWDNYIEKLKQNWENKVRSNDTVIIAGDICWAMNLEESLHCFEFIENLPGKKILLKGNHDYWWSTKTKIENFFEENNFSTIKILHNNHYIVEDIIICGTRGWIFENGEENNTKIINREAQRLKLSLDSRSNSDFPTNVFLHYPPVYGDQVCQEILEILKKYNIKKCYYGHIHGEGFKNIIEGQFQGIEFKLVSSDYVSFDPITISDSNSTK